jgi:hypothetical protein
MQRKFSPELITECQRVLSKKAGYSISKDQAEIALEAFARLGNLALRFLDLRNNRKSNEQNHPN